MGQHKRRRCALCSPQLQIGSDVFTPVVHHNGAWQYTFSGRVEVVVCGTPEPPSGKHGCNICSDCRRLNTAQLQQVSTEAQGTVQPSTAPRLDAALHALAVDTPLPSVAPLPEMPQLMQVGAAAAGEVAAKLQEPDPRTGAYAAAALPTHASAHPAGLPPTRGRHARTSLPIYRNQPVQPRPSSRSSSPASSGSSRARARKQTQTSDFFWG